MASQRIDAMLAECVGHIEEIAASEADISSSSNRLLAELSSVGRNSMSSATQMLYKRNTEVMLNTLIAYTNSAPSKTQAAALSATIPGYINTKIATDKDENDTPASVVELQTRVHNKCRQIRHNRMVANIINETIQQELGLN